MPANRGRRFTEQPTAHGLFIERRLYDAAHRFIEEHHYPPTVREVAAMLGYANPSSAAVRLHSLRRRGYVTFVDGQPRTLVLVRRP